MPVKQPSANQHLVLHQKYGLEDCCLCKAEAALKKAGCPCCDGYHFPAGNSLVARLADAEADVERWKKKHKDLLESEHALSDSYLRLRKILDVPSVLINITAEAIWALTEEIATEIKEDSDILKKIKDTIQNIEMEEDLRRSARYGKLKMVKKCWEKGKQNDK